MRNTSQVIVMRPVLEIYAPDGFALWPVAGIEPFSYLPLLAAEEPLETPEAAAELGRAVPRSLTALSGSARRDLR